MKNFKSKFLLFSVTGILSIMALAGCQKKEEKGLTELTLNEVAHSIFYAPQYAAIELGYFEEEGISLNLVNGAGADNVMTALISGDADIGFMGSEASIYVYAEGSQDYAVNFAQLTQRAGNFLVAREEQPDFKWTDLKGHEVLGGRAGGMPEMVFEYILKQNGINPATDLSIVQNINFGLTAGAFSGGQGEYTVEFEPFATALELEGKGHVIASLGEDNAKVIQSFTNAIQKGINYVNTHSAEEIAATIAPQFPETETINLVTIVERYLEQDTWKTDTVFSETSFNLLQDILIEAGELEARVPYEDLVTTEFSLNAVN